MAFKSVVAVLVAACCVQYIAAQTQYFSIGGSSSRRSGDGSGEEQRAVVKKVYVKPIYKQPSYQPIQIKYKPAAPVERVTYRQKDDSSEERTETVQVRAPVERVTYRQRDSSERYNSYKNDDAKYKFAYRVQAGGYGSDDSSEERGYGGGRSSANFGHSESRDGDRTTGAYFVELPDGRLQRVDYYVDGYSGYVARVSYSGAGKGAGYSAERGAQRQSGSGEN